MQITIDLPLEELSACEARLTELDGEFRALLRTKQVETGMPFLLETLVGLLNKAAVVLGDRAAAEARQNAFQDFAEQVAADEIKVQMRARSERIRNAAEKLASEARRYTVAHSSGEQLLQRAEAQHGALAVMVNQSIREQVQRAFAALDESEEKAHA